MRSGRVTMTAKSISGDKNCGPFIERKYIIETILSIFNSGFIRADYYSATIHHGRGAFSET
jgi:hypothetical protein